MRALSFSAPLCRRPPHLVSDPTFRVRVLSPSPPPGSCRRRDTRRDRAVFETAGLVSGRAG